MHGGLVDAGPRIGIDVIAGVRLEQRRDTQTGCFAQLLNGIGELRCLHRRHRPAVRPAVPPQSGVAVTGLRKMKWLICCLLMKSTPAFRYRTTTIRIERIDQPRP